MSARTFLIVVDMQKDFIDGSLGTKEAQAIVPGAAEVIRDRRVKSYEIIATLDTHGEDYLHTREGKYLPIPHCVRGTAGWELDPLIREALGDARILEKPTFGSVRLPALIAEAAAGQEDIAVEFIGLCTDICVVSNALLVKAHFPEADVSVLSDCCAGVTPEKHEAALETMRSCQINIV